MNAHVEVHSDTKVAAYLSFARMARRNALERLAMAREWPSFREEDEATASECWERARHYLAIARRLKEDH